MASADASQPAKYRTLKSIFHERGQAAARAELARRLEGYSTYTAAFMVGDHQLFYVATTDIVDAQQRILQRERDIDALLRVLPSAASQSYLTDLAIRGIIATDEIEGVRTTRKIITDALASENANGKRAREFVRLLEALGTADNIPATPTAVREVYDRLLEGQLSTQDKPDGKLFRAEPVSILDGSHKPIHRGVMPEEAIKHNISVALKHASDSRVPGLFSAIIAHFMVEYTHPFYDGNGRLGRYLLSAHLAQILNPQTVLTLSATLNAEKKKYYKAFSDVENLLNYAEATPFLRTLLTMLEHAQQDVLAELTAQKKALDKLRHRVSELEETYPKTHKILFLVGQMHLFHDPVGADLKNIAQVLESSEKTARSYLRELEEMGLVHSRRIRRVLHWSLTNQGAQLLELPTHMSDE